MKKLEFNSAYPKFEVGDFVSNFFDRNRIGIVCGVLEDGWVYVLWNDAFVYDDSPLALELFPKSNALAGQFKEIIEIAHSKEAIDNITYLELKNILRTNFLIQ